MTQHDPSISLMQMRQFAEEAIGFVEGKSKDHLLKDRLLTLGLLHLLSTLGEAGNRLPVKFREQYPQIPWRAIIGMRNRLVHAYDVVDVDVVWLVITEDLPELIKKINAVLDSIKD